jgi:hypothetical protein
MSDTDCKCRRGDCRSNKRLAGLKEQNRRLRQELFNLRVQTNGCGICDSCDIKFVLPGISVSSDYKISFHWKAIPGMKFKIESSTDQHTWTELEAEYPAVTEDVTYQTAALTPAGAPIYYRITELPIVYDECP